jgi:predicted DNA-binding transcriptional regulator AlpA
MTKKLVGVHEIEERFGLNRMQVYRLLKAGDFPAPEVELANGRVWDEAKVERVVEKWRALGRINEQGIVVPWRFLDVERPRRRASA